MKSKGEVKTRFACIGTVALARKVIETMFILMKNVKFICRGRHEGRANVETYRDIQGQTRTDRDRQRQTRTIRHKHGQTGTCRDKQGQKGNVHVCPCLSLFVPALSLLFPDCSCTFPSIDWHNW